MTQQHKAELTISTTCANQRPHTRYTHTHTNIQLLLRKKAAEELKKEQERKAAERRRIIEERCGRAKDLASANEGKVFGVRACLCVCPLDPIGFGF